MHAFILCFHISIAVLLLALSMRCSATQAPIPLPTATVEAKGRQAHGAAVLAIGTANPTSCVPQEEYADWYFRVTKSEHLRELKAKMERICESLMCWFPFSYPASISLWLLSWVKN